MIVTVTPNPSLDRTLEVARLERGAVLRSSRAQVDPGGKGINVVRALVAAGFPATAIVPVGGAEGHQLVALLRDRGIEPRITAIAGAVRSNIALVEPDGTVTKVNEPGPVLRPAEVEALLTVTADAARGADWVVSCGSLPAGAPEDLHAQIVRQARVAGARTAVDTSDLPLLAALTAGPDLIKPNADELAAAVGHPLVTVRDVVAAGHELRRRGAGAVLASLGADGAVLITATGVWHAECPVDAPVSAVGAGDATLAGFLTRAEPTAALRAAVAYGTAAVQLPGSAMPGPHDLDPDRVRVTEDLDLDRRLADAAQDDQIARAGV